MTRILSKGEHEYLRGEKEIESGSAQERTVRNRIRDHIKESVKEFSLIQDTLSQKDKELIFDEMNQSRTPTSAQRVLYKRTQMEPTLGEGLISMASFIYECCQNTDTDFERVLEMGITDHHEEDVNVSVDIQVDKVDEIDVQEAARKHFFSDESVTRTEIEALTRHVTEKLAEEHDVVIGGGD